MSVWRGADDVPHSGILPPYEAGWWPDPASFCRRVSCQVADITSHVKHTTTTTTCQKLLKLVDPRLSYSVLHQCHLFETQSRS